MQGGTQLPCPVRQPRPGGYWAIPCFSKSRCSCCSMRWDGVSQHTQSMQAEQEAVPRGVAVPRKTGGRGVVPQAPRSVLRGWVPGSSPQPAQPLLRSPAAGLDPLPGSGSTSSQRSVALRGETAAPGAGLCPAEGTRGSSRAEQRGCSAGRAGHGAGGAALSPAAQGERRRQTGSQTPPRQFPRRRGMRAAPPARTRRWEPRHGATRHGSAEPRGPLPSPRPTRTGPGPARPSRPESEPGDGAEPDGPTRGLPACPGPAPNGRPSEPPRSAARPSRYLRSGSARLRAAARRYHRLGRGGRLRRRGRRRRRGGRRTGGPSRTFSAVRGASGHRHLVPPASHGERGPPQTGQQPIWRRGPSGPCLGGGPAR